jgi:hypothetical protein
MTQYLVAIHRLDGYDGTTEDAEMREGISALNREMIAAGVRLFAGGLQPPDTAIAVRRKAAGELLVTDGPYLETKEHIGGFWILDVKTREDALLWAKKAAEACRCSVEARPFF